MTFALCVAAGLILVSFLTVAVDVSFEKNKQHISESRLNAKQSDEKFDAHRLRTGRFLYRIVERGKDVGKIAITIHERADGTYGFIGEATGKYNQRWETTATSTLEPISAVLRIGPAEDTTSSMSLKYENTHVTGTVVTTGRTANTGKAQFAPEGKWIDASVPPGTVDQRIDWAAVLASRQETGQKFDFTVYDPWTGVSHVTGRVGQVEQIRVPSGTYEAYRIIYRIESSKGTDQYQILSTKDSPHMSLREEFPSGIVSELAEISEIVASSE